MLYNIPFIHKLSYESIPRNQDLKLTIQHHCDFPSRTMVVDSKGNCFVCACEAWLPISVGHILDFKNLLEVWDNPVAKSLQKDIDEKKFTHCAVDRCGIIDHDQISADYCMRSNDPGPVFYISINLDESCNLVCPSCRRKMTMDTEGSKYEQKLKMVQHFVELLADFPHACHLILCGSGDPLASNILRPLLHQWQAKPNQTIRLFTNGLLLQKQLTDNPIVKNITQYFISIDAGSAAVYEQVRRPGKFDILLRNFDWLRETVDETKASVLLKFVLQDANHDDMQNFIDLCMRYNFDGIINRLENWDTWRKFKNHDVIGNIKHPNHARAMRNLKDVYAKYHHRIQFNSSLGRLARE